MRTEDDPELPQAANSAFIVDLPSEGWTEVREVETMHGSTGRSEILIEDLRVPADKMLGGRGEGHLLGQSRLGPARLAHCRRWTAQAEMALDRWSTAPSTASPTAPCWPRSRASSG